MDASISSEEELIVQVGEIGAAIKLVSAKMTVHRQRENVGEPREKATLADEMLAENHHAVPVPLLTLGRRQEILSANRAAAALLGAESASLVGLQLSSFFAYYEAKLSQQGSLSPSVPSFMASASEESPSRLPTHAHFHVEFMAGNDVEGATDARLVALLRRHDEALRVPQHLMPQRDAIEYLAGGKSLELVLAALLETFELLHPEVRGSILLLQHGRLWHGAAPRLPRWYIDAIDGIQIGPEVGSCGAAASTGRRVVVADVLSHPNWHPYCVLATRANIRACWSEPILSPGGEVLGTFAMYFSTPREPEPHFLELMRPAAHLASIAIQRRLLDLNLAKTKKNYRQRVLQRDEELQLLKKELRNVAVEKLEKIGQLLHDEVGQHLTALSYLAGNLYDDACAGKAASSEKTSKLLEGIELAMQSVREVSWGLLPAAITAMDLRDSLRRQAEECYGRFGVPCEFQCREPVHVDGDDNAMQLFLIAQEAIKNAVKHANAAHITVRLLQDDNEVVLEIEDDGAGFDGSRACAGDAPSIVRPLPTGLGLMIMRRRASKCGGHLEIRSIPGKGTLIRCRAKRNCGDA